MRLAVIGLGYGQAVLLPVLRAHTDVRVTAVAGRRLDKAREIAAQFDVPNACASLDEVMELGVDALAVALPPAQGQTTVATALDAGLAVLAEKPLALDAPTAAALAAKRGADRSVIDFCYPEIAAFQEMRRRIAAGDLGPIVSIDVAWLTNAYAYRNKLWSWRLKDGLGGILGSHGVHVFHFLEALFGPVRAVCGVGSWEAARAIAPQGEAPAMDRWSGMLSFADAPPCMLTLGNASGGPQMHTWRVIGERSGLEIRWNGTLNGDAFTLWDIRGGDTAPVALDNGAAFADDWRKAACSRIVERWLAALRNGAPCDPDLRAGARAQAVSDAAEKAARERVWVDVN